MSRYTEDHEWVAMDGDVATVGITDYAQKALGDVVFVEVPEVGGTVAKGDEVAVVESVKAASEVYAPLDGEIVEVNEALADEPALVNTDATGDGWFFKMKLSNADDLDDLMDEAAYNEFVAGLE